MDEDEDVTIQTGIGCSCCCCCCWNWNAFVLHVLDLVCVKMANWPTHTHRHTHRQTEKTTVRSPLDSEIHHCLWHQSSNWFKSNHLTRCVANGSKLVGTNQSTTTTTTTTHNWPTIKTWNTKKAMGIIHYKWSFYPPSPRKVVEPNKKRRTKLNWT